MAAGHSLELSLSLSFFHRKSRRFFGSTWLGPRRLPDDGEGGGADFDVAYKSMLYWYSHVDDQECLAIVELVATQLDTSMKGDPVTVAQYGCGWTYLRPFGSETPLPDASDGSDRKSVV